MIKVIVNAKTGERTIVKMTQEEIDELIAQPPSVDLPGMEERVSALEEAVLALLEA